LEAPLSVSSRSLKSIQFKTPLSAQLDLLTFY